MKRFVACLRTDLQPVLWGHPAPERHYGCEVLFRGYIANKRSVAQEIGRRGLPPEDESTGELLAGAYRCWGADLAVHVLGEYSVALFDPAERRFVLTHDGLGVKPVFRIRVGDRLYAASHLSELLRAVETPERDPVYAWEHLLTGRHDATRTPYRGMARLAPGKTLVWENGREREQQTWDLTQSSPVARADPHEYEEEFRRLLAEAVRTSLPEQGRVWSELSGGLDSSSIVSIAGKMGVANLEAFSLIYSRSTEADERSWIRRVLKRYPYPWRTIDADRIPPFSEVPTEFFGDPNSCVPYEALRKAYEQLASRHGVDVVLSGNGGDHVLLGEEPEPLHLSDLLRDLQFRELARGIREWQECDSYRRPFGFHLWRHAFVPAFRHLAGREVMSSALPREPAWIEPAFARRVKGSTIHAALPVRCRKAGDQYYLERIQRFVEVNGTNMSQCVRAFEFRYPMMYRPLVEFMFAVPWGEKLQPDFDRSLHRRAMRGILPEAIRTRTDKGGPDQAVFEGLRRSEVWQRMLTDKPRLVAEGFADGDRWARAVESAEFANVRPVSLFIQAATFECWLRQRELFPGPDLRPEFTSSPPLCYDAAR